MASDLTVRFQKGASVCRVEAWRRTGKPFPVSTMGGGTGLPHDLVTFVVERELGLCGGFFNLTAHGAIFRSSRRRFTRPGRALIAAHRADLDAAERTVNATADTWRAGRPTSASAALDAAASAWSGLAVGESIELTWPTLPLPGSAARRPGHRGSAHGRSAPSPARSGRPERAASDRAAGADRSTGPGRVGRVRVG
jgi:hypothetical protein